MNFQKASQWVSENRTFHQCHFKAVARQSILISCTVLVINFPSTPKKLTIFFLFAVEWRVVANMNSRTQIVLLILSIVIAATRCSEIHWDHTVDLDENFRLLWKVKEPDILFEVQVQTLGYVGFGFTRSEYIYGGKHTKYFLHQTLFFIFFPPLHG